MKTFSLLLAHGSGAGHSTPFLSLLASILKSHTSFKPVTPITFSYMKKQQTTGLRCPPPRINTLIDEYRRHIGSDDCVIAGKSLGGRVATQLTHLKNVKAVICFGFPFHPQGKPEKHRLSFLKDLNIPCLIIQGTRDRLGNYDWVTQQTISSNIEIVWIHGADHDFNRLKSCNKTPKETAIELAETCQNWLKKQNI